MSIHNYDTIILLSNLYRLTANTWWNHWIFKKVWWINLHINGDTVPINIFFQGHRTNVFLCIEVCSIENSAYNVCRRFRIYFGLDATYTKTSSRIHILYTSDALYKKHGINRTDTIPCTADKFVNKDALMHSLMLKIHRQILKIGAAHRKLTHRPKWNFFKSAEKVTYFFVVIPFWIWYIFCLSFFLQWVNFFLPLMVLHSTESASFRLWLCVNIIDME